MSIDDAVATAIEQNLDLQVQRFNPQIQDANAAQFKANYAPNFTSTVDLVDQTQPPSSLLSGNTSQITNGRSTFNFGLQQQTPWYGGSYQVAFQQRPHDHQQHLHQLRSAADVEHQATYTQPLLRNFKIDGTRQQLLVSQKNKEISDMQLQQSIALHRAQRAQRVSTT